MNDRHESSAAEPVERRSGWSPDNRGSVEISRAHIGLAIETLAIVAPAVLILAYGVAAARVTGNNLGAGTVLQAGGVGGFLAVVPRAMGALSEVGFIGLVLGAGGVLVVTASRRLWKRPTRWRNVCLSGAFSALFVGLGGLGASIVSNAPWWPLERLTLNGSAQPCHGYVVGSQADGQYLVVLTEPERAVRFYPTELVDRAVVDGHEEQAVADSCPDGVARP